MKRTFFLSISAFVLVFSASAQHDPLRPFEGKVGKYLEDTQQWYPDRVSAPTDAPNVLLILLDDVGFGSSTSFGGLIETPTFDSLAYCGLRYTNFHTTGICSPTRAALLTGRNAHSVGMGHHAELGIGTPGYSGDIPFEAGTIAEILRENGYNTFALGKWHGNRTLDLTAAGPFNRYPTGRGFDHFFGFLGGATDQWYPNLVEGISQVKSTDDKKHLNALLSDKAITYIANQKSANPNKPFFLYYAPGATHSPHQVAREWIDKYKGKFDKGWDAYREEVFQRQLDLSIIPANTVLPPRQAPLQAWDSLSEDERKVYARFFETYAGFLSYTDHEIGRVVNYLKKIDQFDNTLILVVIGDNGGSKEGSYTGTTGFPNNAKGHDIAFLLKNIDKIGTEYTYPNYPLGWSQATNTPFRYWKSDANSEGATHNPLIIHYPRLIQQGGGLRNQYGHVTDILPTIVEIVGARIPKTINGYEQLPIHGVSLGYSIHDQSAPTRHTQQYYEIHGGRAIYKDGWKAAAYHPRSFFSDPNEGDEHFRHRSFESDKWELYHLEEDWNETTDLSAKYPDKLKELIDLFDLEANKYNVYPLRNYRAGVAAPVLQSVYTIYGAATAATKVHLGTGNIRFKVAFSLSKDEDGGVLFANGGLNLGGASLYIKDNRIYYTITDDVQDYTYTAENLIFKGDHVVELILNREKTLQFVVNGVSEKVVDLSIPANRFLGSTGREGISIGYDQGVPVTKRYPTSTYPFTAEIDKLTITQDETN